MKLVDGSLGANEVASDTTMMIVVINIILCLRETPFVFAVTKLAK